MRSGVTLTYKTWDGKIGLMLSFWQFWLASLKTAWSLSWKLFGHSRAVASILTALVLVGGSIGFAWIVNQKPHISAWLTVGPVVLLVLLWIGFTFRGAYMLYRQCYQHGEIALKTVEEEVVKTKGEINRFKMELQELEDKDAKAANEELARTFADRVLAGCITSLQNRISELREVGFYLYSEGVRKVQTARSQTLLDQIEKSLAPHFPASAVSSFYTTKNVPAVHARPDTYFPERYEAHKRDVAVLEAFLDELKTFTKYV